MKNFIFNKITENIYLVEETGYLEFANIFIFTDNNKCLIFDSGVGIHNLKKFLQELGYSGFKVMSTHAHFDHIGGLADFGDDEIYLTERVIESLNNMDSYALLFLKNSDFNFKKLALKAKNNFPLNIKPKSVQNEFNFGEFRFELFKAPGHSDDSVIFYEKNHKILITGDSLYNGKPYLDLPSSSKKEMRRTLKLIERLNPIMVLPGHNEILRSSKIEGVISEWKSLVLAIH